MDRAPVPLAVRGPETHRPLHLGSTIYLDTIPCRRHPDEEGPALPKQPFKGELGERIHREICQRCWQEWLTHQTVLMNHYGLDPRDKKAKDFLYGQLRAVLFDEGERADVDTSKQGTIDW